MSASGLNCKNKNRRQRYISRCSLVGKKSNSNRKASLEMELKVASGKFHVNSDNVHALRTVPVCDRTAVLPSTRKKHEPSFSSC